MARRSLWLSFAVVSGYTFVELVGGLMANSLALLADAGHMLTDAASLGLTLVAIWLAERPASTRWSFGLQRAEVLAALANVLTLWLIAAWIFLEAYRRFQEPSAVLGPLMLAVGSVGLLVNAGTAWILRRPARESLNVEGAFLHVIGDLMGSVAVVVGSLLIITLGWSVVDPIFGALIGLLILLTSSRLLWKVVHVLLEGTPLSVPLERLCSRFEQVEGVTGVHDVHIWTLTSGYDVLSAHVITDPTAPNREHLLYRLRDLASKEFGIAHATLQLEDSQDRCNERHHPRHGNF